LPYFIIEGCAETYLLVLVRLVQRLAPLLGATLFSVRT